MITKANCANCGENLMTGVPYEYKKHECGIQKIYLFKSGYAIVDDNFDVQYSDFSFTEEEFKHWYKNQIEMGFKVAKITLELL